MISSGLYIFGKHTTVWSSRIIYTAKLFYLSWCITFLISFCIDNIDRWTKCCSSANRHAIFFYKKTWKRLYAFKTKQTNTIVFGLGLKFGDKTQWACYTSVSHTGDGTVCTFRCLTLFTCLCWWPLTPSNTNR